MSDISRITLSPNGGTRNIKDNLAIANITRSGTTYTVTRRNGSTFTFDQQDNNTTYTLTQDLTDGHIIIFTDSTGNSTSITIPDTDTNYTIEADTTNNQIKLVPSSGTATAITVPFATNATNAVNATKATQDESGNNIKASYGASLDISDHTISLKNKNGIALSTVTVPDNNTTYTFATGDANGQIKVTPSGGSAQNVDVKGLGTAAFANIASTYSATGTAPVNGTAVAAALATLPTPMTFQGTLGTGGTITTLPTASASTIGHTYRVITDGTYAGQAAKDGDEFIGAEIPKDSGTYVWIYIPAGDEPSGTVTNIATGTGLTGGPITMTGTISHADTSSQASVSNSGRTYIQSITLDGMGHVTGLSSATETVTNTDRYVNSAAFADDTTANANNPVKMTLTRAGSDSASVVANIPKVSSSSAGVAPKGTAVSSQSQTTKFLREDGVWAAPSYTTNTDTTYTIATGDANGQIKVTPSSGSAYNVNVKGLGSNAYSSTEYVAKAGDTMTGTLTLPEMAYPAANDRICGFRLTQNDTNFDGGWNWTNRDGSGFALRSVDAPDNAGGFIFWARDATRSVTMNGTPDGALKWNSKRIVTATDATAVGSTSQPVYVDANGYVIACTYTLEKSVPSNAVFTDTNYYHTTGSWSGLTYTATANGGAGALAFTIPTGTSATTVAVGNHNHDSVYVKKAGDTMTGLLSITPASGGSFNEGIRLHPYNNWNAICFCGADNTGNTGTSTNSWTVCNNNGNFYISRNGSSSSSSAQIACVSNAWSFVGNVTVPNLNSTGNVTATTFGVNASNGSSGGISLYAGATYADDYGIYFRTTTNKGKHGYVTSDWATYFTMSNTNNRGWVFRRNNSGNVASIDTNGQMVLNGSLTVGGNPTNTSGCRMVYNSTLNCLDFQFAS